MDITATIIAKFHNDRHLIGLFKILCLGSLFGPSPAVEPTPACRGADID